MQNENSKKYVSGFNWLVLLIFGFFSSQFLASNQKNMNQLYFSFEYLCTNLGQSIGIMFKILIDCFHFLFDIFTSYKLKEKAKPNAR